MSVATRLSTVGWLGSIGWIFPYLGRPFRDCAVLAGPGWESRYYIRSHTDDGVLLAKAEQTAEERLELWGVSIDIVERYLFGVFGWDVRSIKRLPTHRNPVENRRPSRGIPRN